MAAMAAAAVPASRRPPWPVLARPLTVGLFFTWALLPSMAETRLLPLKVVVPSFTVAWKVNVPAR